VIYTGDQAGEALGKFLRAFGQRGLPAEDMGRLIGAFPIVYEPRWTEPAYSAVVSALGRNPNQYHRDIDDALPKHRQIEWPH